MKKTAILVALTLVVPAALSAAQVYQFKGTTVNAAFFHVDARGCVETNAYITLYDNREKSGPGAPGEAYWCGVTVFQYDRCTDEQMMLGFGEKYFAGDEFWAAHNMSSATLAMTMDVWDDHLFAPVEVRMDLAWVASGPPEGGRYHSHYQYPGMRMIVNDSTYTRPAQVVGGFWMGGENMAESGAEWASIGSSQRSTVSIEKTPH